MSFMSYRNGFEARIRNGKKTFLPIRILKFNEYIAQKRSLK